MAEHDDLISIFNRIRNGSHTEEDIARLRQLLVIKDDVFQLVNQDGQVNSNIGQVTGGNIHVGNIHYHGADAETISKVLQEKLLPKLSQEELENLNILYSRANDLWIPYLESTLNYKKIEDLEIKLKELPNAVQQDPNVELAYYTPDENTTNKNLIDVFNKMGIGRKLLILGYVGSGKTTIILTLLKNLIENYKKENFNQPLLPVPVFLNLSSWTNKQSDFAGWVIEEIVNRYNISSINIAEKLISNQRLMLLLDGLDEVNSRYRKECIKKLNSFIKNNGRTEIILCSRLKEYEDILSCNLFDNLKDSTNDKNYCEEKLKLGLSKAFYIKPLENNQIERYLTTKISNRPLTVLLRLLKKHEELRNPLIVFIIMQANINVEDLPNDTPLNEILKYLFEQYIKHMLTIKKEYFRRSYPKYYKNHTKTTEWLHYLAKQMKEKGMIFQIEQIQPSWLLSPRGELTYPYRIYRIAVGLTVGLILGLTSGLYFIYVTPDSIPLTNDLVWKLITIGLVSGLITGLIEGIESYSNKKNTVATRIGITIGKQAQRLRIHRIYLKLIALRKKNAPNKYDLKQRKLHIEKMISTTTQRLIRGGVPGIIFALFIYIIFNLINSENLSSYYSAIYLSCIFSGMSFSLMRDEIKVAKIGSMDSKKIFICSLIFTFFGIPYVTARLLLFPQYYQQKGYWFPIYELMIFMIIGGIYGAVIIKKDKLNKSQRENHQRNTYDNEIINLRNYAILSFVSLIVAGILVGWFVESVRTPVVISIGLVVGFLGGLAANEGAGIVCIQHFILRTILYFKGDIPNNYAQFLNYANERGLLNKVGNSYFFITKLLDYLIENNRHIRK